MKNSTDAMKDSRSIDYANMVMLPKFIIMFVIAEYHTKKIDRKT